MILKAIRTTLGSIILAISWLTRGRTMQRSEQEQLQINAACKSLVMYEFHLCPFCIKVRRTLHKLNLPIALRDAKNNQQYRSELEQQGGKIQVPCLRIEEDGEVKWLYESSDINQYLYSRFNRS